VGVFKKEGVGYTDWLGVKVESALEIDAIGVSVWRKGLGEEVLLGGAIEPLAEAVAPAFTVVLALKVERKVRMVERVALGLPLPLLLEHSVDVGEGVAVGGMMVLEGVAVHSVQVEADVAPITLEQVPGGQGMHTEVGTTDTLHPWGDT
jgi:hypothetical protein